MQLLIEPRLGFPSQEIREFAVKSRKMYFASEAQNLKWLEVLQMRLIMILRKQRGVPFIMPLFSLMKKYPLEVSCPQVFEAYLIKPFGETTETAISKISFTFVAVSLFFSASKGVHKPNSSRSAEKNEGQITKSLMNILVKSHFAFKKRPKRPLKSFKSDCFENLPQIRKVLLSSLWKKQFYVSRWLFSALCRRIGTLRKPQS